MAYFMRSDVDMLNNLNQPIGECIPQETVLRNVRLAMAYVPFQKMCTLFSPMEALKMGTAFPELFSPYEKKDKKTKMGKDE